MNKSQHLPLFLTRPHPCSYLPQTSQSLCLDPHAPVRGSVFSVLTEQGFRRSGHFIYRPHCPACTACIPVRIPVAEFVPDRQQQRVLKRGSQLVISVQEPRLTDEYYQLYQDYIETRHADGDMYPPSVEQFESFLCQPLEFSRFYEFRKNGTLMAVAVTDVLDDALSAVYSFFAPHDNYYSLGRYAVLWQIMHAKRLGLEHLYLGYWIRDCTKMNYKTQYQPIEYFFNERWQQQPPA